MDIMALFDWITLRDYDRAKALGQRCAVARYSRGNTLTQIRRYLNDADSAEIIRRGDRDMARLERAVGSR